MDCVPASSFGVIVVSAIGPLPRAVLDLLIARVATGIILFFVNHLPSNHIDLVSSVHTCLHMIDHLRRFRFSCFHRILTFR